jgi:uncharacterized membrane protein YjjP (DUF1212 family)
MDMVLFSVFHIKSSFSEQIYIFSALLCCISEMFGADIHHTDKSYRIGFKHQAVIIQNVLCLIPGAMFVFGFFCLWVEIFTLVEGIV